MQEMFKKSVKKITSKSELETSGPGSGLLILILQPGSWVLDLNSRILGPGVQVPDPEPWVTGPGSFIY